MRLTDPLPMGFGAVFYRRRFQSNIGLIVYAGDPSMGPSSNNMNLPDCGCLVTSVADITALRSLAAPKKNGDPIAAIIEDDGTLTWDAAAVPSPEGVDDNTGT